jgi:hypothetical protein
MRPNSLCLVLCFFTAGFALGGEPVRLAEDALQPQLTTDGGQRVWAVFLHRGNVCVVRSEDGGRTFSEPITAIDAGGNAKGGMHRGPRIGVDEKGGLVVTCPLNFDSEEARRRYPRADLYFSTSVDGGETWREARVVNESSKKAPEALHWMVVAPDGTAHVAWLDLRSRAGRGQDLYYSRIEAGRVTPNVKLAETVCECCAPGLARDGRGNPWLAWREGGEKPSREVLMLSSIDGGEHFGPSAQVNLQPTLENG